MESKTLSAVLVMAINKEIEAQSFYLELHNRVADPEARQTLIFLANEEKKHQEFLSRYQKGETGPQALSDSSIIDYKIAEHLEQPDVQAILIVKMCISLLPIAN
jgi:rubrerythrin